MYGPRGGTASPSLITRRRRAASKRGARKYPENSGRSPPRVAATPGYGVGRARRRAPSYPPRPRRRRNPPCALRFAPLDRDGMLKDVALVRKNAARDVQTASLISDAVSPHPPAADSGRPEHAPSRRPRPTCPPTPSTRPDAVDATPGAGSTRGPPPQRSTKKHLRPATRLSIGRRRPRAAGCWRLHAIQLRSAPRPRHRC